MEKIVNMMSRGSGKTIQATKEFLENPTHTVLIVVNHICKASIIKTNLIEDSNIISQIRTFHELNNIEVLINRSVRGKSITKVIIDEYLLQSKPINFDKNVNYLIGNISGIEKVSIYTSVSRQYDLDVFERVVIYKRLFGKTSKWLESNITRHLPELIYSHIQDEVEELFDNILTDDNVKIDVRLTFNDEMKSVLSDMQYETAIKCVYLKRYKFITEIVKNRTINELNQPLNQPPNHYEKSYFRKYNF